MCYCCSLNNFGSAMVSKHPGKLAAAMAAAAISVWFCASRIVPEPPVLQATKADAHVSPTWFNTGGARSASIAPQQPSLSARLDRLLATRDPADTYKAYWLIQDCMYFLDDPNNYRTGPILPGSVAPAVISEDAKIEKAPQCSGLTQRMRSSRIDYLTTAARAKVSLAAIAFYREGPFGDPSALESRPNDPLVQEWKNKLFRKSLPR